MGIDMMNEIDYEKLRHVSKKMTVYTESKFWLEIQIERLICFSSANIVLNLPPASFDMILFLGYYE